MRITVTLICSLIFSTIALSATPNSKVAKVIVLRGKVSWKNLAGKISSLKKNDWLPEKAVIMTKRRSMAKLIMSDKSNITVGPNSDLEIKSYKKGKVGVVNLLQGAIRSRVNKNALDNKAGNKLIIKTRTAAMGVRGTDFLITYNPKNRITNTITYSGEVVMTSPGDKTFAKAVRIFPGQFSTLNPMIGKKPTVATKLSPSQFHVMNRNKDFREGKKIVQAKLRTKRMIIPPGLNMKKATVGSRALDSVMGKNFVKDSVKVTLAVTRRDLPPPEGFIDTKSGTIAPPAGGLIDLKSGVYIPPPPGSVFDENTGVYVPPETAGSFDEVSGEYIPPAGVVIDEVQGTFVQVDTTTPLEILIPVALGSVVESGDIGEEVFEKAGDLIVGSDGPTDPVDELISDETAADLAEDIIADVEAEDGAPNSSHTPVTFNFNITD